MRARQAIFVLLAAALSLSVSAAPGEKLIEEMGSNNLFTPAPGIDDGLGELSPFETWTYPWLYAIPAAKLDSGLGDLPPYSEWQYPWVYSMPAEKIDNGLGEIRAIAVSEKPVSPELRIR